eukprot:1196100-Prorocentrum_minimum.AAC.3
MVAGFPGTPAAHRGDTAHPPSGQGLFEYLSGVRADERGASDEGREGGCCGRASALAVRAGAGSGSVSTRHRPHQHAVI